MNILVQKFGGTSVATDAARTAAISHIEQAVSQGYQVVVVVSAMGRRGEPYATDTLLSMVPDADFGAERDLDILMSCGEAISSVVFAGALRVRGHDVTVLSGGQAGIQTSVQHGSARILRVDTERLISELQLGRIVVVMGFQGMTDCGDITTLGRGGSDTTATALGVALSAERVDIFTDVVGIMTADPRIVDDARLLGHVTYAEICNLAYHGAKVIHPRAVEIAMQKNIPIRVRSTYSQDEGTLVTSAVMTMEDSRVSDRLVTGVTQTPDITQIVVEARDGPNLNVFELMAQNGISVDFISVTPERVTYTVSARDTARAVKKLQDVGLFPNVTEACAKVAIVGAGIAGVPGIMARIVNALSTYDIDILQSADSHTTIWCLVSRFKMEQAVRALHQAFELGV